MALQLGHRLSVDLDFFTQSEFSTELILQEMQKLRLSPQVLREERGTLTTIIKGAKVSMFHYPYPFIDKTVSIKGVPIAGILDIASMKIIAISQRGAKRDFIDLYFILQDMPFWKIAKNMIERYGSNRINPVLIGKSLVYFRDAENDPEPLHCKEKMPKWDIIKKFFIKNIQQMVIDLQKTKGG
ncbi:MAG: nucleotidyl transferase AbiEii/AbiGii toxin family protein [Nitrospirae bacterium]|nr:nucleotidyl transferase AbiEii/AbiGii toxin family protein [Nitrospirota bacterium]